MSEKILKSIQLNNHDYVIDAKYLGGKDISDIENCVKITYEGLNHLKNLSNLIPGKQYRITDYITTTSQENTISAEHQFDIIVIADDVNKLNEKARAIQHEGDTYFEDSNLSAWEIWYCLDNDTNRFSWASRTGKGVIYRMIDEFGNDCPYDFKNIKFLKTDAQVDLYVYTFNNTDNSDNSMGGDTYGNVIKTYSIDGIMYINKIKFGKGCYNNTFSNNCYNNTFGNNCYNNTFGYNCYNNTFGYNCSHNTFDNYCQSNTFGDFFHNNTFGNYCYNNTFGNDCYYNTFGYNCYYNTFGNYCFYNTFGNNCSYNIFGTSTTDTKSYYRCIIFENGNRNICLNCTATTSSTNYFQNVRIALGANNTGTKLTIDDSNVNQAYETVYGKIIVANQIYMRDESI